MPPLDKITFESRDPALPADGKPQVQRTPAEAAAVGRRGYPVFGAPHAAPEPSKAILDDRIEDVARAMMAAHPSGQNVPVEVLDPAPLMNAAKEFVAAFNACTEIVKNPRPPRDPALPADDKPKDQWTVEERAAVASHPYDSNLPADDKPRATWTPKELAAVMARPRYLRTPPFLRPTGPGPAKPFGGDFPGFTDGPLKPRTAGDAVADIQAILPAGLRAKLNQEDDMVEIRRDGNVVPVLTVSRHEVDNNMHIDKVKTWLASPAAMAASMPGDPVTQPKPLISSAPTPPGGLVQPPPTPPAA